MDLRFLNGPRAGENLPLSARNLRIGRETDNDIQLLVGGVSRYHAKITLEQDGFWYITDLGSTNGTKINGVLAVEARKLGAGDLILIGDQEIKVEEASSPKTASLSVPPPVAAEELPAKKQEQKKAPVISIKPAGEEKSSKGAAGIKINTANSDSSKKSSPAKKEKSISVKKGAEEDVLFQNPDTAMLESIFSDTPASGSSADGKKEDASSGNRKKGAISSLLFYVILGAVAVVCIALFLSFSQPDAKKTPVQLQKKDPNKFFLAYEKEELTRSSIFRFEMLVECRWERREEKDGPKVEEVAMVSCSVVEQKAEDNIAYKYVLPPQKVDLRMVEKLRKSIQDTDFMKLKQDSGDVAPESSKKNQRSCIKIGYNGNYNSVTVQNTSPKLSYNAVEDLIEEFTEDALGVRTVSMSVQEMRSEAKKHYERAVEYFDNYEAKPENLRLAIKRFELTVKLLERFQPRPKMWTEASNSLQKAEKILAKIKKEVYDDLKIKLELKEYPEALLKAKLLMDYLEPDSKNYLRIRNVKINIERELARTKTRSKRRK